jgi:hypothetical protein
MRNIRFLATDNTTAIAVVQLESGGGGEWVKPGVLRTIKCKAEDVDSIFTAGRLVPNKKFEQLQAWDVDLRNQGPRSNYFAALQDCIQTARDDFGGNKITEVEGPFYDADDLNADLAKQKAPKPVQDRRAEAIAQLHQRLEAPVQGSGPSRGLKP